MVTTSAVDHALLSLQQMPQEIGYYKFSTITLLQISITINENIILNNNNYYNLIKMITVLPATKLPILKKKIISIKTK